MKINYTNYMNECKTEETDKEKLSIMFETLKCKMQEMGLHGSVSAKYFTDGKVLVSLNGEYYNVFDANKGEFYSGFVGDLKQ